tara:strand:+ start:3243 stop:3560 length:318 start_codon:yes stop_codon:yes gene_type:complete
MKYNVILKIPSESEGTFNQDKIVNIAKGLGYKLLPVQGAYNKFWITSKVEDGKRYELIDGPRYYKLVINSRDFGIESGGDFNGWNFAGGMRKEIIKEAKEARMAA